MSSRPTSHLAAPDPSVIETDIAGAPAAENHTDPQFRSQVGYISRQSGIYFLGTIFTIGLGYLFKIYLARVLGAEALGIYALGATLVGFVSIFNTFGLPESAVRYVAVYTASGQSRHLHSLLWTGGALLLSANIVFALILLVGGRFIAVHVYHSKELARYLPWFALMLLPSVLGGFYSRVLAGYKDLRRRTVIVNFIGAPLNMLLAILLIGLGLGLRGYLLAQILGAAVVLMLLLRAVRALTPPASRVTAQTWARLAPEVWSFSSAVLGITVMEFVIAQVDKISLGVYLSARDVGIYSVAAAVVAYVPLILYSVNQIFAPTIADLHTSNQHALMGRLFRSLTKWMLAFTIPLATVVVIFARPLMRIFGAAFEPGWPILVIGSVGQLVNCGVGSVGYLLLMSGNERRLMKVQAVMTVVTIALSFALVPLWGVVGAACAAAITNVGINVWNLLEVRDALSVWPYDRSYLHLILPTLAAIIVSMLVKTGFSFARGWIAIIVAMFAAYAIFAAVALLFGLDSDDRMIAVAIWAGLRSSITSSPIQVKL